VSPTACFLQHCRAPQLCNASVSIVSIMCSLFLLFPTRERVRPTLFSTLLFTTSSTRILHKMTFKITHIKCPHHGVSNGDDGPDSHLPSHDSLQPSIPSPQRQRRVKGVQHHKLRLLIIAAWGLLLNVLSHAHPSARALDATESPPPSATLPFRQPYQDSR